MASQRYKVTMTRKAQAHVDRTKRQVSKTEESARPKDPARIPVKRGMRDRHLLEHVIATRNDEYMESVEHLPEGYVADIDSLRRLPRDTKFHVRSGKRVYYWG